MNYDQIIGVNFSTLKHMERSPAHYIHHLRHPQKQTPAMAFGVAFHMAVLEPERFAKECTWTRLDRRTKAYAQFAEENAGKSILSADDAEVIAAMRESLRAHAGQYLRAGSAEHPVVWVDEATGKTMKGRLDLLSNGCIIGLKTCQDAAPYAFARDVAKYHYHAQWAMYYDGVLASRGDACEMYEIAVEKTAPYDVVIYRVPADVIGEGRALYRRWLARLVECESTGNWPGVSGGEVVEASLPGWAKGAEAVELEIGGESYAY